MVQESVRDMRGKEWMRPKLVNCCGPEQMSTKEFGKMLKRIQTLEEGRVPAKKNWRTEREKKRITRKEYKKRLNGAKRRLEVGKRENNEGSLMRPLKFSVKGGIWKVVVVFPGMTSWVNLMTCLIACLFLVRWCVLCLT